MSEVLRHVARRFDTYSLTARAAPGLLVLLGPVAVAVGAGATKWPSATTLLVVASAMGLPLALADWVRRRGQKLQRRLWEAWGGNPVVAALREEGLIASRRREILTVGTGVPVEDPTSPQFEEAADNAVRRLISATRNISQYPLVFAENKNYGFARNLLAVRPVGVGVSAFALVSGVVIAGVSTQLDTVSTLGTTLGAVGAALAMAFWLLFPSEGRVLSAANDYRDRLLETLDAGALGP